MQEVTVSFLTTKLKGEDQNTLKGGALLQLLLIIGLTITTTTTVLYSYNDQMDCCWTCSGHLQENHEIELNTNLSVDTLCVYYIVSSHNLLNILKNVQHVDDFPQEKASISWWTSNDDQYARNFKFRTNRYEYFDQCYSHCEITYFQVKSRRIEMLKKMFVQKACWEICKSVGQLPI